MGEYFVTHVRSAKIILKTVALQKDKRACGAQSGGTEYDRSKVDIYVNNISRKHSKLTSKSSEHNSRCECSHAGKYSIQ
jgi:hypothetical protein